MKISSLCKTFLIMAITTQVWAGKTDQSIIQEAEQNQYSVGQAIQATETLAVTLTGHIAAHSGDAQFKLEDGTGVIQVEIDTELAKLNQLKAGTKIKIMGELKTRFQQPNDVEVVKIEFLT